MSWGWEFITFDERNIFLGSQGPTGTILVPVEIELLPLICLLPSPRWTQERKKIARPCSPTLGQVDWFSWKIPQSQSHPVPPNLKTPLSHSHLVPPNLKTPLSHSHPVPPNLKTPLSQSHLSHVLKPVPTCPIWLYHLSFPNSLFSDFSLGFSLSFHFSKNTGRNPPPHPEDQSPTQLQMVQWLYHRSCSTRCWNAIG